MDRYIIVSVRSWYGPSRTVDVVRDDTNHTAEYETVAMARAAIEQLESGTYTLEHNEASRPEYYVVPDIVEDWLMDSDGSRYAWDAYDGVCGGCGDCDACLAWMREEDVEMAIAEAL